MSGHAAYYLLRPALEHPAVDIHGTGNLRERQTDPAQYDVQAVEVHGIAVVGAGKERAHVAVRVYRAHWRDVVYAPVFQVRGSHNLAWHAYVP
ncbi:MAG: hypothetical protein WCP55_13785, partial [Lentisphaerota bacterium]